MVSDEISETDDSSLVGRSVGEAAGWVRRHIEQQQWALEAYERALIAVPGNDEDVVRLPEAETLEDGSVQTVPRASEASWWPASNYPVMPLVPAPGYDAFTLAGKRLTVTLVSVFGLVGDALASAVALVARIQRRGRNFAPVFVTDSPEHEAFTRQGFAFEYFPRGRYRDSTGRLDRERVEPRLQLIERKWNVTGSLKLDSPHDLEPMSGIGDRSQASGGRQAGTETRPAVNSQTGPAAPISDAARGLSEPDEQTKRLAAVIRESGLFDERWYLARYPDVARSGRDPVMHYLEVGAEEGRDPSPLFHTEFYARQMLRGSAER